MLDYIKGTFIEKGDDKIILDVNGMGFSIFIPHSSMELLPRSHAELFVFVSLVIREFSWTLFGFLQKEQKVVFEQLLSISGVGPKLAMNIIGYLSLDVLQNAVLLQDVKMLCQVPGIGKKTAERLIVELKNIVTNFSTLQIINLGSSFMHEATSALTGLGYSLVQAQKAVKKAIDDEPEIKDLDKCLRLALKNMK